MTWLNPLSQQNGWLSGSFRRRRYLLNVSEKTLEIYKYSFSPSLECWKTSQPSNASRFHSVGFGQVGREHVGVWLNNLLAAGVVVAPYGNHSGQKASPTKYVEQRSHFITRFAIGKTPWAN
jgi:hypothetical protein